MSNSPASSDAPYEPFLAMVHEGLATPVAIGDLLPEVPHLPTDAAEGTLGIQSVEGFEVLAEKTSPKAALFLLAASHGLTPAFPSAVIEETRKWIEAPEIDDPSLEDLRDLAFITIDGKTSRDLDQALHIERNEGGYRLRYALADAAHYIRPGTALFEEALKRGASYYMPGVMVPMLPKELSEGLVSLNPDVERRSMLFDMQLDGEGRCTKTRLARARIRSRAKLDWGGVQAYYDGERAGFSADIDAVLALLKEVGTIRMQMAEERGVIRYRRSEVSVSLDEDEPMGFVVHEDVRRAVERYNEQISLLCNVEGAKLLRAGANDEDVEPIYRVHPPPTEEKLQRLEQMLDALARAHSLTPDIWKWTRKDDRSLGDYLDALPEEGFQGRLARAVHRQAVMANVRSSFATEAGKHHGVGAEVYARFSAPMREIVGIFLHLEAWEAVTGEGSRSEELRQAVVTKANASKRLQSQISDSSNRLVLDRLFASNEGGSFVGTVMGMSRGKIYVMLDAPSVDVKVYLRHQQRHGRVRIEDDGASAWVKDRLLCRLGDEVQVKVEGRDEEHDRWVLTIGT